MSLFQETLPSLQLFLITTGGLSLFVCLFFGCLFVGLFVCSQAFQSPSPITPVLIQALDLISNLYYLSPEILQRLINDVLFIYSDKEKFHHPPILLLTDK